VDKGSAGKGWDRPMIEAFRIRAIWIEQHILPYERDVRTWLKCKRFCSVEIDDVIQEMYAKISALPSYDHIRDPHRYALAVAQSIVHSSMRRNRLTTITPVEDIEAIESPSDDPSPEDIAAAREELRQVEQILASMPQRTRDVFVLRRIRGLSQRETANNLQIAEKTVEKHLARAVILLMERFKREGKESPDTSLTKGGVASNRDCDES
jgi:RNA polymerase sigma-70 factor (ECF subfamily)